MGNVDVQVGQNADQAVDDALKQTPVEFRRLNSGKQPAVSQQREDDGRRQNAEQNFDDRIGVFKIAQYLMGKDDVVDDNEVERTGKLFPENLRGGFFAKRGNGKDKESGRGNNLVQTAVLAPAG